MKLHILVFILSLVLYNFLEELQTENKRLTFKESFDKEYTFYILDTKEEYKNNQNLMKNETIKNSSTYTYE